MRRVPLAWPAVVLGVGLLVVGGVLVVRSPSAGRMPPSVPQGGPPTAPPAVPAATTPPIAAGPTDLFVDDTERAGIRFVHHLGDARMDNLIEAVGSGGCVLDADGDGRFDLYLVDQGWGEGVSDGTPPSVPPTNRLYRNRGDGTFEDVTERAGVGDAGFGFGALAADVDGDGDVDLYVLNRGPNRLYRNRGDGTFEDATESSGTGDPRCSVAGTFFDADGDRDLDLYVGNYVDFDPAYRLHYAPDVFPGPLAFAAQDDALYLNRGDGTFEDATERSGLRGVPGRAMGVVAFDATGDGHPDLFVANDATANFLWVNLRSGDPVSPSGEPPRFEERGLRGGVAYGFHGEATAAMAGSVGDADGDGRPDLFVTDTTFCSLLRNLGDGRFQDRVRASGLAAHAASWPHWGGGFLDFDLDGDLDVYAAAGDLHHPTGRRDLLLANRGDGTYEDASALGGAYFRAELLGRGGILADLDDDGDTDVVVTNVADRAVLLRNRGVPGRHFVTLSLRGRAPATDAFGARVTVEAGGRRFVREHHAPTGYLAQNDPRLLFGLGSVESVDAVEIVWPDGQKETRRGLAVDRIHRIVQGEAAQ